MFTSILLLGLKCQQPRLWKDTGDLGLQVNMIPEHIFFVALKKLTYDEILCIDSQAFCYNSSFSCHAKTKKYIYGSHEKHAVLGIFSHS